MSYQLSFQRVAICPVAIPEIFAQTLGSDYWQQMNYVALCVVIEKVLKKRTKTILWGP